MKELTEIEKAYLAGFLDGEGCLWLYGKIAGGNSGKPSKLRRARWHTFGISISNTDKNVLQWIKDVTGLGSFRPASAPKGNNKPKWQWSVVARDALSIIEAIYPYLITKKPQARTIRSYDAVNKIAVEKLVPKPVNGKIRKFGAGCRPPKYLIEFRNHCERMIRRLNHRGSVQGSLKLPVIKIGLQP